MKTKKTGVPHRAAALIGVLLCIELLDEVIDGLTGAAWPLIRADVGLSYTDIGLLFSVPTIVAHVIEPLIGLAGDAWRRFVLIALGGLAYATALVMFAGADGFWTLLVGMALLYPASGTFVTLSQSSLMDLRPDDEERAMVIWTIAGSVGVAAGPLVLIAAQMCGLGWRTAYVALGGVAVVLAAAVFALRPRHTRAAAQRPTMRESARTAWAAIRQGVVIRWLAVLAGVDLLLDVFVGFLTLYFVDVVGVGVGVAAAALATWTVTALVGEAALIWLIERADGLRIVRRSAVVVLGLLPLFLVVDSVYAKFALIGGIGLLSAGWYSIVKAQFFRAMPGNSGAAMAVSSLFGPVQAVVPLAVGALAEYVGLGDALWLVLLAPVAVIIGAHPTTSAEAVD